MVGHNGSAGDNRRYCGVPLERQAECAVETAEGALSFAAIEDGITGAVSELDLRQADNIDGDPVNLFTGEHRTGITAGFDEDVRLLLTGSSPTPSTVLAVSYELETSS